MNTQHVPSAKVGESEPELRWRKSSRSDDTGGQCVEVASMVPLLPGAWRKGSRSDHTGGQCVEVAELAAAVAVRDSKAPDGPKLVFGAAAWRAFTGQVKGGRLDLS
ncbi:DUF397 domain-containing protein [Actinomadura terrae]|uniref:DUF397 domain-containing protein n=1 Tax=Actinomadura terrae TaxID=604353 RepID=UPI002342DF29|nr:DUF397 domain-containing protein [Actinomadura terrae]